MAWLSAGKQPERGEVLRLPPTTANCMILGLTSPKLALKPLSDRRFDAFTLDSKRETAARPDGCTNRAPLPMAPQVVFFCRLLERDFVTQVGVS